MQIAKLEVLTKKYFFAFCFLSTFFKVIEKLKALILDNNPINDSKLLIYFTLYRLP